MIAAGTNRMTCRVALKSPSRRSGPSARRSGPTTSSDGSRGSRGRSGEFGTPKYIASRYDWNVTPKTRAPDHDGLTDADYRSLLTLRDGLRRFLHWSAQQAESA